MKLDRLYKQSSQYSVSTQIKHQQYARRLSHKPNESRCQCGKIDEKMGNYSSAHVYIMTYYQDGKHKRSMRGISSVLCIHAYSAIYIQNRWLSHSFTIYTLIVNFTQKKEWVKMSALRTAPLCWMLQTSWKMKIGWNKIYHTWIRMNQNIRFWSLLRPKKLL